VLFDLHEISKKNKNVQFVYFAKPEIYPSIKRQIDKGKIVIPEITLQNQIPPVLLNKSLNLDSLLNLSGLFGFLDTTFLFSYKFIHLDDVNAYKILSVLREIKFHEKVFHLTNERIENSFDSEFGNYFAFQDKLYSVHSDSVYQIDLLNNAIQSYVFLDSTDIFNIIKQESGSTKSALKYFEIKRKRSKEANYLKITAYKSLLQYPYLLTYSTLAYPMEHVDDFYPCQFFVLHNLENNTKKYFLLKYSPMLKLEYLLTNQFKKDLNILLVPIVDYEKNEITWYEFNVNNQKAKEISSTKLPYKIYSGDLVKLLHSFSNNFIFFRYEPYYFDLIAHKFFNLSYILDFFSVKAIPDYTIYHPVVPEIIIKSTDYHQLYAEVNKDTITIVFSYNNLFYKIKINFQFELLDLGITNKLPICKKNEIFISKDSLEFYLLNKNLRRIIFYQLHE
jgi:hypothetical protein